MRGLDEGSPIAGLALAASLVVVIKDLFGFILVLEHTVKYFFKVPHALLVGFEF